MGVLIEGKRLGLIGRELPTRPLGTLLGRSHLGSEHGEAPEVTCLVPLRHANDRLDGDIEGKC